MAALPRVVMIAFPRALMALPQKRKKKDLVQKLLRIVMVALPVALIALPQGRKKKDLVQKLLKIVMVELPGALMELPQTPKKKDFVKKAENQIIHRKLRIPHHSLLLVLIQEYWPFPFSYTSFVVRPSSIPSSVVLHPCRELLTQYRGHRPWLYP